MKSIKIFILIALMALTYQTSYSQGCEGPGEGDGIKIFGFIQPQYQYSITGVNDARTPELDKSSFFFNRARLGVMGNIPYDFSYYFIMEYAPAGGFAICDAYVSYDRYKPYLSAAVGQFKAPFGAEQMQGCHKLYTIDRSDMTNELAGPIRDMGLLITGSTGEKLKISEGVKDVFTYQFAYMNGEGRDVLEDANEFVKLSDNLKTFVGRLTFTPFKYITLGGSYKTGKYTPLSTTATEDDSRTRLGFDAAVKYKKFTLQGEYIQGTDKGSFTTGGGCGGEVTVTQGSTERSGYYVTAFYKIKEKFEPIIKYESYGVDELNSVAVNDGHALRWTAGFNYHFNEWTRLQINYQYNFSEAPISYGKPYQDGLQIQLQAIIK